jgi:hypothetical protein
MLSENKLPIAGLVDAMSQRDAFADVAQRIITKLAKEG